MSRPAFEVPPTPAKWTGLHLYVILAILRRYVVDWLIAERESAELTTQMICETVARHDVQAFSIEPDGSHSHQYITPRLKNEPLSIFFAPAVPASARGCGAVAGPLAATGMRG
jgi:hypothetical protein